jgi:hypothetical protein
MPFSPSENGRPKPTLDKPFPSRNGSPTVETPPASPPPEASGRDAGGRFAKGNGGGPGNPFTRRTAAFRRAFCEAISEAEVQVLARQLYEQALLGDKAAAKLVLAYLVGKPAAAVDPDSLDLEEWRLYQRSATAPEELRALLTAVPPGPLCTLLQVVWPLLGQSFARQLCDHLPVAPPPVPAVPSPAPPVPTPGPTAEPSVRTESGPPAAAAAPPVLSSSPRRQDHSSRRFAAGDDCRQWPAAVGRPVDRQQTDQTAAGPATPGTAVFNPAQGGEPAAPDQATHLCLTG